MHSFPKIKRISVLGNDYSAVVPNITYLLCKGNGVHCFFPKHEVINLAYVPVPKDLTKVKTKFLFNLTKRQVICFGAGALIGLPLFFLTKGTIGTSAASFLMIIVMMPCFMLAIYEQHGEPLEVVLKHFLQARFLRPKKRVYQTNNFYAVIDQNIRTQNEVKQIINGKRRKTEIDPKREKTAPGADEQAPVGTEKA